MSRFPKLDPAAFSPGQRRVHDEIAAERHGTVRGPFAVWLRTPAIADAANRFGNSLRRDGKLDRRLFELAILSWRGTGTRNMSGSCTRRKAWRPGSPAA
jgi:4-carboxymuconolactone decarboxylase